MLQGIAARGGMPSAMIAPAHVGGGNWGETGGTPPGKDEEIWVRMIKFTFHVRLGRAATTGVFCKGYVEKKGLKLAPQVGLEPTTLRLTAEPL